MIWLVFKKLSGWGLNAREIDGYKLWYSGLSRGRNGVGILVEKEKRSWLIKLWRSVVRVAALWLLS